jgi:hypothetical protein
VTRRQPPRAMQRQGCDRGRVRKTAAQLGTRLPACQVRLSSCCRVLCCHWARAVCVLLLCLLVVQLDFILALGWGWRYRRVTGGGTRPGQFPGPPGPPIMHTGTRKAGRMYLVSSPSVCAGCGLGNISGRPRPALQKRGVPGGRLDPVSHGCADRAQPAIRTQGGVAHPARC